MPQPNTLDDAVEMTFASLTYENLTSDELRGSNYPDSNFSGSSMGGIDGKTGYEYSVELVIDHPNGPYLKIDTEKRKDFLKKGPEREANDRLREVALSMRLKTGGYFEIHPFYGAIFGTDDSSIVPGFCAPHSEDDNLSTIICLTDKGGNFDGKLTREAISMGTTIEFPGPNARRFLNYMDRVNQRNPNQQNRDQAVANGLGKQWDAEFERYNPHAKREGLIARFLRREKQTDISPAMELTQNRVADFMDYLQTQLGFRYLVTFTCYEWITSVEFEASTLPKTKVAEPAC